MSKSKGKTESGSELGRIGVNFFNLNGSNILSLSFMAYNTLKNIPATIQSSLENKADLVDGALPSEQLPEFIDARLQVLSNTDANLAAITLGVGEIAAPTNFPGFRKGDGSSVGGKLAGPRVYRNGGAVQSGDGVPTSLFVLSNLPSGTYHYKMFVLITQAVDETNLVVSGATMLEPFIFLTGSYGASLSNWPLPDWSQFMLEYGTNVTNIIEGFFTVSSPGVVSFSLLGFADTSGGQSQENFSIASANSFIYITPV